MTKDGETYTIGIFKRDGSGGHAITPFAVQDNGDGTFAVLVYDNNYPEQTRSLTIDANANTWSYEASINPQVVSELYEGDANTKSLALTPTSIRLNTQNCPFCEQTVSHKPGPGLAVPAQEYNQVYLDGEGHLIVADEQGNRLGIIDGKLINEIPGARVTLLRTASSWDDQPDPVYWIPDGKNFIATIDGNSINEETATDLVMIGPGFSIGVEGITLSPNQQDTITFLPQDEAISYETENAESPNIVVGIEQPAADYYFEVQGTDMQGGGTITVLLNSKDGDLIINSEKLKNEGHFDMYLTRITEEEEETYSAEELALKAGSLVYVNYAEWQGNGTSIYFGADTNGDGTIDDEYSVDDAVSE